MFGVFTCRGAVAAEVAVADIVAVDQHDIRHVSRMCGASGTAQDSDRTMADKPPKNTRTGRIENRHLFVFGKVADEFDFALTVRLAVRVKNVVMPRRRLADNWHLPGRPRVLGL